MPAFKEVLLVLSRPLIVASLTACFVLLQTAPVLVTGGGWEEEVARRTVKNSCLSNNRFVASVYVYSGSTELRTAAFSALSLRPGRGDRLFCLNAGYCLCFQPMLGFAEHSCSTSTLWLKFPVGAMLSSGHKLFVLAMKVDDKLSDVLVWLASIFAFRIVFLRRSSM